MSNAPVIIDELVSSNVASRLFSKDHTLWVASAQAEAKDRLNWVDPFSHAAQALEAAQLISAELAAAGISRIVLCGMGGSSLGPEVLANWAHTSLVLLDSTHPSVVQQVISTDLAHTAIVVSSKSGSTVETRSHLACFEAAFDAAGIDARQRVVVVTDPGSQLEHYAHTSGYRVVCADPRVGGRFSVLTAFGIVPAVLSGVDMQTVLSEAATVRSVLAADSVENPALQLAAHLYAGLPEQYVAVITEPRNTRWGLGDWIEQLVAESTGKSGIGLLPIASPILDGAGLPAHHHVLTVCVKYSARVTVEMVGNVLQVSGPLGAQFLLWEAATAILGHLMGIDPFNQPDVESAKVAARAALLAEEPRRAETRAAKSGEELINNIATAMGENGYLAIQAYLQPGPNTIQRMQRLGVSLSEVLPGPVSFGWGPRYLHSTGQLHKGGPETGVYLQVIEDEYGDYSIPNSDAGFGALIRSQVGGDRAVLIDHHRPVFVLSLTELAEIEKSLSLLVV